MKLPQQGSIVSDRVAFLRELQLLSLPRARLGRNRKPQWGLSDPPKESKM